MDNNYRRWAQELWNYLRLDHHLIQSDIIIGLGCHDIRVAEKAASLYLEGWAPLILFTGYLGSHTVGVWYRPEAEIFAEIAIKLGVPKDHILLEKSATNTGENIRFSYQFLMEHNIPAKRIILVQQPFMERWIYATFLRQWPGEKENIQVTVTSPAMEFNEYPNQYVGTMEDLTGYMLGVVERIQEYPKKGFQVEQPITQEVLDAYQHLIKAGYQPK
ncbi:uncharacterized protein SCO4629-like [Protopterus annectens]|uniref:uncharacterized protein SCO4629-like n=1 Tax=Protopterus annectens TaxID=7888 RepID=UPI001CF93DA8|nr:uncharacterized protein SCO4629-like [Protopterus annectens]